MSANRNDISQITNYLKGTLDARAMYQLERNAQDDLFLMDALEGFEIIGTDQNANLAELKTRLAKRVAKKKDRNILLARVLPIAACLLLLIGGYWLVEMPSIKHDDKFARIQRPKPAIDNTTKPSAPFAVKKQVDGGDNLVKNQPINIASPSKAVKRPIDSDNVASMDNLVPARDKKVFTTSDASVGGNYAFQSTLSRKNKGVYGNVHLNEGKDTTAGLYLNTDLLAARSNKNPNLSGNNFIVQAGVLAPSDSVIRGYVKINKPKNDGYIITGKEVQDNPVGNVEQLLQGKVARLNIQNNTGAPGVRGAVNIRGLSPAPELANHLISGKITDTTGKPLAGIIVHGANAATTATDADGKYHILVNRDTAMLITGLGYQAQNIMVKPGQSKLDVKLKPGSQALAEVSIRGYVKRTRDQTTGASYIITGKECKENLRFKKRFFNKIAVIERYVTEHANGDSVTTIRDGKFLRALKFIARRAPITITVDKTAYGYADLKVFSQNKERWLHWYELNKCNNLK